MNKKIVAATLPTFTLHVTLTGQATVITNWASMAINCELKNWEIGNEVDGKYPLLKAGNVIGYFTEEVSY